MEKLLIFDLDGTLVNTSEGIFATACKTVDRMGLDSSVPPEKLREFIGPPIRDCFKIVFDFTDSQVDEALPLFNREYDCRGQYLSTPYPGMRDILVELKRRGYRLAVGTLKRESVSRTLLEHHGLSSLFEMIVGSVENEKRSKSDIITRIYRTLGYEPGQCVMIGDTAHDTLGAVQSKVRMVAVTWGFGYQKSFSGGDGVSTVLHQPSELLSLF